MRRLILKVKIWWLSRTLSNEIAKAERARESDRNRNLN